MNLGFLAKRVGKILSDVGCPMILRRQIAVPYNPHEIAEAEFEEYSCAGVITSPSRGRKADRSSISSSYVSSSTEGSSEIRILMRADILPEGIEPASGDQVIIEGVIWNVVQNNPVKPAGKHIMHKLVCKP
jgi:hypothetical protein